MKKEARAIYRPAEGNHVYEQYSDKVVVVTPQPRRRNYAVRTLDGELFHAYDTELDMIPNENKPNTHMTKNELYSWLHSNAIEFDSAETAQAVLSAAIAAGHPVTIHHVPSSCEPVLTSESFLLNIFYDHSIPTTIYPSIPRHKACDVSEILLALLSPPVEEPRKIKRVLAKDLKPGDRFRYACEDTDDDLRELKPHFIVADFGDGITFLGLDEYEQGRIEVWRLLPPDLCALYNEDGTPIYENN